MTGKSEAKLALLSAARAYRRAEATLKRRREELHAAILRSTAAGETKSQIARDTGYTREYVTALISDAEKQRTTATAE
jgi:hypothetical protein